MSSRMSSPRLPGDAGGLAVRGRLVPYETADLPDDFVQRLHRLKELTGLTWNAFSDLLGVDPKQMLRWRDGTEPCGGAYRSLVRVARWVPGGLDLIVGEDFLASLLEE